MSNKYRIAFRGEVADGFSEAEVRATLAARLNRGDDIIERMFSGNLVTLAKDLEFEPASEAATKLARFGAVVYLVDGNGNAVKAPMPANDDVAAVESPDAEEVESAPPPDAPPSRLLRRPSRRSLRVRPPRTTTSKTTTPTT